MTPVVVEMPPVPREGAAPRTPWYRRDLFRSCKTGEVIEAQPLAYRLRVVGLAVVLAAPLLAASNWLFKTWMPRHYAEIDVLAKTDPVASARQLAESTSLILLAPVLVCVVMALLAVVWTVRILRAGRRPLPGAKMFRRTEVVAGWCARVPAALHGLLLLACLFLVWSSYVGMVVLFWDGYLDKRFEASSKSHSRAPASNIAGVRTLNATGVEP